MLRNILQWRKLTLPGQDFQKEVLKVKISKKKKLNIRLRAFFALLGASAFSVLLRNQANGFRCQNEFNFGCLLLGVLVLESFDRVISL